MAAQKLFELLQSRPELKKSNDSEGSLCKEAEEIIDHIYSLHARRSHKLIINNNKTVTKMIY